MKRSKVSLLLGVALAGVIATSIAAPASADPTPQSKDIVGVGSDTTEFMMNYLADGTRISGIVATGYNAGASARLVSFNATNPILATDTSLILRAGANPTVRPNGSGAGKKTLFTNATYGALNQPSINFGRSSSGPNSSGEENAGGLWHVPYAVDGLLVARATVSNAPASLTLANLTAIYKGQITAWNQIDPSYSAETIVPKLPQSGSGTRAFFLTQIGLAESQVTTIASVQEHDPAGVVGNPNAIAPFSLARFNTLPAGTAIAVEPGFSAQRAVYNVVRAADLTKPFFAAIFGPDGYICSGSGNALIKGAGFTQLAGPSAGGVCGVQAQSAPTAAQLGVIVP
jgi:ABC-type phosphate transport system substrate-binding protein